MLPFDHRSRGSGFIVGVLGLTLLTRIKRGRGGPIAAGGGVAQWGNIQSRAEVITR